MNNLNKIRERIEKQLDLISNSLNKTVAETGNDYRIFAEQLCKYIIKSNNQEPEGMLEKLTADAIKIISKDENSRDAAIFKAEIKYLQGIGNTFSHDGDGSSFINNESPERLFNSLIQVIRISLFGNVDYDIPNLPQSIESKIPSRAPGRLKFENTRAEDVVKLCYPKQITSTIIKKNDHNNKIVYDYITTDFGDDVTKGFIFIRSRTSLEKTFNDFLLQTKNCLPSSLTIVSPRAFRPDGKEIDRKRSITDISGNCNLKGANGKLSIEYFDDFVWDKCLSQKIRQKNDDYILKDNFIPQKIKDITDITDKTINADDFLKLIFEKPNNCKAIQIITGPAGIGKTTFCDFIANKINNYSKKRCILISATDFRDIKPKNTIKTVADLYITAVEHDLIDTEFSLENNNFEINLACGNFVLLIDGFDELESNLGKDLDFKSFMSSLKELEECFQRVLVFLTVRDYNLDRFQNNHHTSIYRLQGFSEKDTDKYLADCLSHEKVTEAKTLLSTFKEKHNETMTIPLYVSLICDYLSKNNSKKITTSPTEKSNVFSISNTPLDKLISKIIDREIEKQSLGNISKEDFFDILIELLRSPQLTLTKFSFIELIRACTDISEIEKSENFLRNPFILWHNDTIRFKYESLDYFFKSRHLAKQLISGKFSPKPTIDFLSEFHNGEGLTLDELRNNFKLTIISNESNINKWFRDFLNYIKIEIVDDSKNKAMSGFFYWLIEEKNDKKEKSEQISKIYGGNVWEYFSIYGKFHSLDLNDYKICFGHLENFSNLTNCEYPLKSPTYFKSKIIFNSKSLPPKVNKSLFEDCIFSDNLEASFIEEDQSYEISKDSIKRNFQRILKVGFKSNRFTWKNRNVYRTASITGKVGQEKYLKFLEKQNILLKMPDRTSNEEGYIVSNYFIHDCRELIESYNETAFIEGIIEEFMSEYI